MRHESSDTDVVISTLHDELAIARKSFYYGHRYLVGIPGGVELDFGRVQPIVVGNQLKHFDQYSEPAPVLKIEAIIKNL